MGSLAGLERRGTVEFEIDLLSTATAAPASLRKGNFNHAGSGSSRDLICTAHQPNSSPNKNRNLRATAGASW